MGDLFQKRSALAVLVASCLVPPHCIVCDALSLGRSGASRPKAPRHAATNVSLVGSNASRPKMPEIDASKLQWLHIPRSGSAMANILITWACPGIPDNHEFKFGTNYEQWNKQFAVKYCEWGFRLHGESVPMGFRYHRKRESQGNMVTFIRDPEQRIISAFNEVKSKDPWANDLEIYAWQHKGCVTRMLNGRQCDEGHASQRDAYLGILALIQNFAFVGLTHEWDLSVCLFHKMFGGKCHRREFKKLHPGKATTSWYKADALNGARDTMDGSVYDEATIIFWRNIKKYGVNRAACLDICSAFPNPFHVTNDTDQMFRANESPSMDHDSVGRLAYIEH